MIETPIDVRPLESRRRRSGWFLRCPQCSRWARRIYVIRRGVYTCGRCRELKPWSLD